MKRFLAPLILCSLVLAALPAPAAAAGPASPIAKYLCLIVLDAGRPDYITKNLGSMPNLRAFLQHSRFYNRAWVGDLMSITPPGHAVIGTGSLPKNDGGIVNWDWGQHSTGTISPTFQDKRNYLKVNNYWTFKVIKDSGTPTLAGEIRRKYPTGLVIAGSGAHFHAAGPMGGPDASWIFAYDRINGYWAPYTLGPHPVPSTLLHDRALWERLASSNNSTLPLVYDPLPLGHQDTLVMNFTIRALQLYRPRGIMINLPEVDTAGHWSHRWHAEEARLYETFDRDFGRLIQAYKSAGIYDQTLFVITADHGMIQSTNRVLDRAAVGSILKNQNAPDILVNGGGAGGPTMMSIWLKNPAINGRVAKAIYQRHLDNVSAIFYIKHRGARYYYNLAGCEQCSPNLIRTYRYLLSTEAGPNAEDIAILLRENARNSGLPQMPGRHGGGDWGSQQVTLIFSGPGVQPGYSEHPARLADLAPTIERFMGITPNARDGLVLADAFQHPSAADGAAQNASDASMSVYVSALMQRAQSDIRLEAEGKLPNHIPSDEILSHAKRRWGVSVVGAAVLLGAAIALWWAIAEVRRQGTGLTW